MAQSQGKIQRKGTSTIMLQAVAVEIQSAVNRGMGCLDNSVAPDPNHRGAIQSVKIIARDNINGGANESDCSNRNENGIADEQ